MPPGIIFCPCSNFMIQQEISYRSRYYRQINQIINQKQNMLEGGGFGGKEGLFVVFLEKAIAFFHRLGEIILLFFYRGFDNLFLQWSGFPPPLFHFD